MDEKENLEFNYLNVEFLNFQYFTMRKFDLAQTPTLSCVFFSREFQIFLFICV